MNEIVANCPVCNAPIYGQRLTQYLGDGSRPTCDCRQYLQAKIRAETDLLLAQAEAARHQFVQIPAGCYPHEPDQQPARG